MWSFLWQNFLKDIKYRLFIANKLKEYKEKIKFEKIIEIWPWKWAISRYLVKEFNKIYFFEKDETFKDILEELIRKNNENNEKEFNIIWWDVLEADLIWINQDKTFVFWNIPYYITSPIYRKFFVDNDFIWWFFLIQKEVWEKIKSDANKKSYLRWLINSKYNVKYVKTVPAKAFNPAPKVDSCLIYVERNKKKINDMNKMIDFLEKASWYKRKTLGKIENLINRKSKEKIIIPSHIKHKRLEELERWEMNEIIEIYNNK